MPTLDQDGTKEQQCAYALGALGEAVDQACRD